ncbi:HD domain-containing protein [Dethiobacter alkaliphilus]|uniref:Hydrolase (HAD superfamily) n=1 Tax=Dethiobacter alkaliphilus AHT 1 TaxID=555088 RepID=C0GC22_DETAL|nr:HD domain-containing protein [Dethiobacter alkaliphilus]EEG78757.1 hydrolase (HAD superfamily) [Dethiobacter alkaliphilus AHT 1]
MIKKELLELLFEAASIQRWNDHIRPHKGFAELDKQAHKMVFAYVLTKFEESDRGAEVDWVKLIEGGFFEFLHRIVLTDIKPPIFHKLMLEKGELLNTWVLEQLRDRIGPVEGGLLDKFHAYFFDPEYSMQEKKILKAAHYLATNWEFQIIYNLNANLYGLDETRKKIADEIEEHYHLAGVQKLQLGKKTSHFMDLVGQLRFQQRWAQTPRIPETSVLGHTLIVAMLSYLCSKELDACPKRTANNYFAGLFHDLPEVLTRDIVSPVKRSVEGLDELIKEIENRQVEELLLPLLPAAWHKELRYFTEEEFANKICQNGRVEIVDTIGEKYNEDRYSPIDGELIRVCDHFAAYMEAYLSISHGIRSHYLAEGYRGLYAQYRNHSVAGFDFGLWFAYFKPGMGD